MMLSTQFKELLRPNIIVMRVIWFGMTVALFILAGTAYVAPVWGKRIDLQGIPGGMEEWKLIFYVAGLCAACISIFIRQIVHADDRLRKEMAKDADPLLLATNGQTGKIDQERLAKISMMNSLEQKLLRLSKYLVSSLVLNLALNESVVILGAAFSFIWRASEAIIPFFIVGLSLNLFMFPRPLSIFERAAQLVDLG